MNHDAPMNHDSPPNLDAPTNSETAAREALAVLELPEIHRGLFVLDAMVKEAPIEVLTATPIPPGRFLIVVTGGVGEVEAAYHHGARLAEQSAGGFGGGPGFGGGRSAPFGGGPGFGAGGGAAQFGAGGATPFGGSASCDPGGAPVLAAVVHDRLFLAHVAPEVLASLRPDRRPRTIDALGIFETDSVASALDAADRLVKGAEVRLEQLHLARGIRGRSFGLVTGRQDMVEVALQLAAERGGFHARWVGASLIARPDPAVALRVLAEPWGFFEGQEIL